MKHGIPPIALLITLAGLMPFALATAGLWMEANGDASMAEFFKSVTPAFALISYSIVVISFLGGIHFGFATMYVSRSRKPQPLNMAYIWSASLALLAWSVLLFPTLKMQIVVLMLAFGGQWLADVWILQAVNTIPEWYLSLRTLITLLLMPILIFAYNVV